MTPPMFPGPRPEEKEFTGELRAESKIIYKWIAIAIIGILVVWSGWAVIQLLSQVASGTGQGFFQVIGEPSINPRKSGFEALLKLLFSGCLLAGLIWILQKRR